MASVCTYIHIYYLLIIKEINNENIANFHLLLNNNYDPIHIGAREVSTYAISIVCLQFVMLQQSGSPQFAQRGNFYSHLITAQLHQSWKEHMASWHLILIVFLQIIRFFFLCDDCIDTICRHLLLCGF